MSIQNTDERRAGTSAWTQTRILRVVVYALTALSAVAWFAEGLWLPAIPGTIVGVILAYRVTKHPNRRKQYKDASWLDDLGQRHNQELVRDLPGFVINLVALAVVGYVGLLFLASTGSVRVGHDTSASPILWVAQGAWWAAAVTSAIWMWVLEKGRAYRQNVFAGGAGYRRWVEEGRPRRAPLRF